MLYWASDGSAPCPGDVAASVVTLSHNRKDHMKPVVRFLWSSTHAWPGQFELWHSAPTRANPSSSLSSFPGSFGDTVARIVAPKLGATGPGSRSSWKTGPARAGRVLAPGVRCSFGARRRTLPAVQTTLRTPAVQVELQRRQGSGADRADRGVAGLLVAHPPEQRRELVAARRRTPGTFSTGPPALAASRICGRAVQPRDGVKLTHVPCNKGVGAGDRRPASAGRLTALSLRLPPPS